MRLGFRTPGWLFLSGTAWQSKPRRKGRHAYAGQLPNWTCHHDHRTPQAALECAHKETRRRNRARGVRP